MSINRFLWPGWGWFVSMTACKEDPVGFLQRNIYDFDLIISDSANSIAENTNESPIKVHPNPASSELIFTAVGDQPLYNEIKIVSIEGNYHAMKGLC